MDPVIVALTSVYQKLDFLAGCEDGIGKRYMGIQDSMGVVERAIEERMKIIIVEDGVAQ